MTSPTTNKALVYPANGADVNTWDGPVNLNWNAIDAAFGGVTTLSVTGQSGVVTLASTQYIPPIIQIVGVMSANVNFQLPSGVGGFWFIIVDVTGPYTPQWSSAGGGAAVNLFTGYVTGVLSTGAGVGSINDIPPTPAGSSGQLQFNEGGALSASSNLTTDTSSLTVAGNVIVGTDLVVDGAVSGPLDIVGGNAQTQPEAVAFSATVMAVNCALSNVFATTLTGNVTTAPTFPNVSDGQTINWFLTQDATGSRTMTWPVAFKWPGGSPGVLSTAANAVDLVVATYRAATGNFYASLLKGFA